MVAKVGVCFLLVLIANTMESHHITKQMKSHRIKRSSEEQDTWVLMAYGPFGGSSGGAFTDRDIYWKENHYANFITAIKLCYEDTRLRGLQFTYGSNLGTMHGATTADCTYFELKKDAYIIAVRGVFVTVANRKIIKDIMFEVDDGPNIGPIGSLDSADSFGYYAGGLPLAYIEGFCGADVDNLIFYVYRPVIKL